MRETAADFGYFYDRSFSENSKSVELIMDIIHYLSLALTLIPDGYFACLFELCFVS